VSREQETGEHDLADDLMLVRKVCPQTYQSLLNFEI